MRDPRHFAPACARVLAILPDGRVLFLEDGGKYNIPGGNQEWVDTEEGILSARVTARRELYEETGLYVKDLRALSEIYSEFRESKRGLFHTWTVFALYLDVVDMVWCRQTSDEGTPLFLDPKEIWLDLIDRGNSPLRNLLDHYLHSFRTLSISK